MLSFVALWRDLKGITLKMKYVRERQTSYGLPYRWDRREQTQKAHGHGQHTGDAWSGVGKWVNCFSFFN